MVSLAQEVAARPMEICLSVDTRRDVVQTTSELLCQRNGQGVFFPEIVETDPIASGEQLSKAASGSIGETLFDLWCMSHRVPVFAPCSNQTKEDRVIKICGRYASVQIKSARLGNSGKTTVFSIWAGNPYAAKVGKAPKRPPSDEDADLLFCIGLDYNSPSICNSFAHVRPWSSALPQSISLPNGVGWPEVDHLEPFVIPPGTKEAFIWG